MLVFSEGKAAGCGFESLIRAGGIKAGAVDGNTPISEMSGFRDMAGKVR